MSKGRVFYLGEQVRAFRQVLSACSGIAACPGEAWSQAGLCVGPRLGSSKKETELQEKVKCHLKKKCC